jgi:murein L,D-transpeptidase YcbB/YkuD
MVDFQLADANRRGFLRGIAALAIASTAMTPLAAFARDNDDQAEWRQSYETSARISVGRESTPTLSPATVAATEAAIQNYQGIVARGGWPAVPNNAELKVGSKSRAVQALRQRLVASGDLDAVAGMGPTFDSFVEAAVKRFPASSMTRPSPS